MNKLNHVAFIMDGNGRWGKKRKKGRNFGHLNGVKTVKKIVESFELIIKSKFLLNVKMKVISYLIYLKPSKNLPCFGTGGLVLTDSVDVYFGIDNLSDKQPPYCPNCNNEPNPGSHYTAQSYARVWDSKFHYIGFRWNL